MLKSKCDVERSFKHSMIRSYVIETFDHGTILLSSDLKSKCFLKTFREESCCSFRVIESRTLQIKIILLFAVEQKQHRERKFWQASLIALFARVFLWFVHNLEILAKSDCLFWRGFIFRNKLFTNFLLELFSRISLKFAQIAKAIPSRYQKIQN